MPTITALLSEVRGIWDTGAERVWLTVSLVLDEGAAPPSSTWGRSGSSTKGNNAMLRAWLTYLKIQTIRQFVSHGGGDTGRQWKKIDEHLAELARERWPYQSA